MVFNLMQLKLQPTLMEFETIEHTADTGIRAYGATIKEAFENAAKGMFNILADLSTIEESQEFLVEVEGEDRETLLVEWLNELLYLYDSHNVLLKRFAISDFEETHLRGRVWGEEIDPHKHDLKLDIKAVTYHMLKVEETGGKWMAQVIFDV